MLQDSDTRHESMTQGSTMPRTPPDDADLYRPNPARIYDAALGGSANFAADRAALEALVDVYPDSLLGARANRAFLRRAVAFLARQGIDRFLDVGSGLPTVGNVHEVAQHVNPQARVVYVDNDPVAVGYSQDILDTEKPLRVAAIEADLRDPDTLLAHREVQRLLRARRPVALILTAVLHFLPDDDAALRAVGALTAALPAGSYVAIAQGTAEGASPEMLAHFTRLYEKTTHPLGFRSRAQLARFFAGFELVEPGIVFTPAWRPDNADDPFVDEPERAAGIAGVGRKR